MPRTDSAPVALTRVFAELPFLRTNFYCAPLKRGKDFYKITHSEKGNFVILQY